MPKNKTHSGTKKRIRVTGSGKLMREKANARHLLEHKSSTRKRRLGSDTSVAKADVKRMKKLLAADRPRGSPALAPLNSRSKEYHVARVKRAVNAHKKRREILEQASGYSGQRSRLYRKAKEQVLHSQTYNFRDRKKRKGNFRQLWIQRINAASRANGMTYNRLIQGLGLAGVEVDRRMLAEPRGQRRPGVRRTRRGGEERPP